MPNQFSDAFTKSRKPQKAGAIPPLSKRGKHIGGYFTPEVSLQLRQLALDEGSSVQALMAEALDLLFETRRLPTIARRSS